MNTEVGYPWDVFHSIHGGRFPRFPQKISINWLDFHLIPHSPTHGNNRNGNGPIWPINEGCLYRDFPNLKRSNCHPWKRPWHLGGKSKVELLAQRLRDQVESGGREGNATVSWCMFFFLLGKILRRMSFWMFVFVG